MTSITLRIPVDLVDSLKELAPKTRHSGYQALLKSYISDGLRRDEAKFTFAPTQRLVQASLFSLNENSKTSLTRRCAPPSPDGRGFVPLSLRERG